jgi:hypothetical protein
MRQRRVRGTTFARVVLLCSTLILTPATAARADWLITPFVGTTFAANTNILFVTETGNKKFNFGVSFGALSDGIFGVEGSVAHVPRFFETTAGTNLVLNSGITTLDGNVIVAVPQAITGYSLRPYVIGGIGVMRANVQGTFGPANSFDSNLMAMNVGGGALGMLSNRTGVRFEVRSFRNLKSDSSTTTLLGGSTRIRFWRATVGVVVRF